MFFFPFVNKSFCFHVGLWRLCCLQCIDSTAFSFLNWSWHVVEKMHKIWIIFQNPFTKMIYECFCQSKWMMNTFSGLSKSNGYVNMWIRHNTLCKFTQRPQQECDCHCLYFSYSFSAYWKFIPHPTTQNNAYSPNVIGINNAFFIYHGMNWVDGWLNISGEINFDFLKMIQHRICSNFHTFVST